MTPLEAVEIIDECLATWSTQALEDNPRASEPFEVQAIRDARRALDVLRDVAVRLEGRSS
jgi:hypothetical protein